MEYRALGRTGVRVSPLCLGCMMFGRRTEAEESYTIIDRALDAGLNFVDTANVYARGKSDEITGQALRRDNRRQRVILATKVHGVMADDDPNASGNSRRHIIAECDKPDLDAINRIVPPGGMVSPFYAANFGPHPYRV